jgi:phosphate starvation-inducible protein PhoH and related proteins
LKKETLNFILQPEDNKRLAGLCGQFDEHLKLIEERLNVSITYRGHNFSISGNSSPNKKVQKIIMQLYDMTKNNAVLEIDDVHLLLQSIINSSPTNISKTNKEIIIRVKRGNIKGRTPNQTEYLNNIQTHDVNFGIGPAGTGKTYLAVACAIEALEQNKVRRLVLVRPAVEAGEKLGFLPGDLAQKVDPYLRPIYDALYEMLGFEKVNRLLEKNIIEIAPLAYMRGRTLNHAFIILDEAQNTTAEQMKMFLTRLGFGSTAVITGDITQIDLAHGKKSGLLHIIDILKEIKGISFSYFSPKDVVRHHLVQSIVEAYERHEKNQH